jgi:hypothetical protein
MVGGRARHAETCAIGQIKSLFVYKDEEASRCHLVYTVAAWLGQARGRVARRCNGLIPERASCFTLPTFPATFPAAQADEAFSR